MQGRGSGFMRPLLNVQIYSKQKLKSTQPHTGGGADAWGRGSERHLFMANHHSVASRRLKYHIADKL